MTEINFKDLFEKAKSNKKGIGYLKQIAVVLQEYALASEIRDIEKTNFPDSEEEKQAKKFGLALNMVGINVTSDKANALVLKTAKEFLDKGGDFAVDDAAKIKSQNDKEFKELEE